MKLSTFFVVVAVAAKYVVGDEANFFSTFKETDIKNFLKDHNVPFQKETSYEELTKLAEAQYEQLRSSDIEYHINGDEVQHEQQSFSTNVRSRLEDIFPSNWDYLKHDDSKRQHQLKDWIFASWSVANLRSFLKSNGLVFKKNDSKYDLIQLAKSHWNDIIEKYETSGNYAGDWLYESWSLGDIKTWLSDNRVDFDPKGSKQSLLLKIKEYNYLASQSILDSQQSLLDSFRLPELNIFKDDGTIDSSFVDTWTYSQLREWLYYHGIIDTKPSSELKDLDLTKLRDLAKANEKYIQIDVKNWVDSAKSTASPYISKKPSSWDEKIEEIINSTFLVGLERWSKEQLQNFLNARDVKFSQFATKPQLIKLVHAAKNTPVKAKQEIKVPTNWLYESWSTEALRDWLQEKGLAAEGTRQQLLKTIGSHYDEAKASSDKFIANQIDNFSPKLSDLEAYLQNSLEATTKKLGEGSNSLGDETLLNAYKTSIEFYNDASKVIKEQYKSRKFDLSSALSELQAQSLEYSKQFDQSDVKEKVGAIAAAATTYANDLSDSLVDAYERGLPVVQNYVGETQNFLKYYGDLAVAKLKEQRPKVEEALGIAKDLSEEASSQLQDAASVAAESASKYGKIAAESGSKYGKIAAESGSKYGKIAAESGSVYGKAAGEAAVEYTKAAGKAAQEYGSDASEAIQNAYSEYQPQVKQAAENSYNYLLQLYSNADLSSYLESFGYSRDFLHSLSRAQLVKLSQAQAGLLYGDTNNKWDKSIVDVFHDAADGFQQKLGFKPKPTSIWSKLKSIL